MVGNISSLNRFDTTLPGAAPSQSPAAVNAKDAEAKELFQQFVGETLFGQMLKSMRKSVPKSQYFHGGRGEQVFQQQLDQILAEKMSRTSAEKLSDPMFELFQLQRR